MIPTYFGNDSSKTMRNLFQLQEVANGYLLTIFRDEPKPKPFTLGFGAVQKAMKNLEKDPVTGQFDNEDLLRETSKNLENLDLELAEGKSTELFVFLFGQEADLLSAIQSAISESQVRRDPSAWLSSAIKPEPEPEA